MCLSSKFFLQLSLLFFNCFFFSYNSFLVLKVFGMEFQYRQLQGVEGCSLFRLIEITKYITNLWNCEAQHQFSSVWIYTMHYWFIMPFNHCHKMMHQPSISVFSHRTPKRICPKTYLCTRIYQNVRMLEQNAYLKTLFF